MCSGSLLGAGHAQKKDWRRVGPPLVKGPPLRTSLIRGQSVGDVLLSCRTTLRNTCQTSAAPVMRFLAKKSPQDPIHFAELRHFLRMRNDLLAPEGYACIPAAHDVSIE